jgi:hypothetical protein
VDRPTERECRDASGLIHMCMDCRRTRWNSPDGEKWVLIEEFLAKPPSRISHGFCPDCAEKDDMG